MFISITIEVIVPVFILIALGLLMDRIFTLDLSTLNRIIFNILIPTVVYHSIVTVVLAPSQLGIVAGFTLVTMAVSAIICWGLFSPGFLKRTRFESIYSIIFSNTGNFGIPVMLIAFGEAGVSVISIMLVTGILILYTIGIGLADKEGKSLKTTALALVKNPTIIAVIIGLIIRAGGWQLPLSLQMPLDTIRDGFVAISLLALGAQIGRIKPRDSFLPSLITSIVRLIGGPVLAGLFVALLGIDNTLGPMLIVGSAMPSAVVNFVIMAEYDRDADFAAEVTLVTTLLSAITLPLVIACCGGPS